MKRIIVFDMDDTLYPEMEFVKSGFKHVGEFLDHKYDLSNSDKVLFDLFTEDSRLVFNRFFEYKKRQFYSEQIKELVDLYRNHFPTISLYSDAKNVLNILAKNYNLELISDGFQESQLNKFKALELSQYIKDPIFTGKWGREYWKPHPRAFEIVEQRHDSRDSSFYYIADNESKDFIAPNKMGWTTVKIEREVGVHTLKKGLNTNFEAMYSITDLSSLDSILCIE